jgi:glycosyltransferase involved in cell wall biosynthesis
MEINDLIVPLLSESRAVSTIIRRATRNQKLDFNQAAGLIVPSVPMCKWIINQYRLSESKVHLILNGTEKSNGNKFNKLRARKMLGLHNFCFCLVFIGNIYREYDFDTILRAVVECQPKIPMIRLLIVGDGPLTNRIKQQVNELGINNSIIFTGYIPHEKLGRIVPAADVGLLIRTKRGAKRYGPVSTKMSTYAFYKLPVISAGSSLKNYPNELGQSIYLVPPEDHFALAYKIIKLYKNAKDRKKKAEILYKFVSKKMTWNVTSKKILEIIDNDTKLQ